MAVVLDGKENTVAHVVGAMAVVIDGMENTVAHVVGAMAVVIDVSSPSSPPTL
jgi:hypothetical protein